MITKNHKTTTVLVAIAALSAILVAGSVSEQVITSHLLTKKERNHLRTVVLQYQPLPPNSKNVLAAGGTSPITGACIATSTNTVTESGGVVGGQ